MSRIKRADIISLVLMICIPVPCFFLFCAAFFIQVLKRVILQARMSALIIAAAFVWGMADIVRHYISISGENDSLERFSIKFTADENADLSSEFKGSIINHRYNIILSLRNSISDIRHEALSEIISSKESGRAVMARYFIGACVMLGLLGQFPRSPGDSGRRLQCHRKREQFNPASHKSPFTVEWNVPDLFQPVLSVLSLPSPLALPLFS